jgi:hypothetical protein
VEVEYSMGRGLVFRIRGVRKERCHGGRRSGLSARRVSWKYDELLSPQAGDQR